MAALDDVKARQRGWAVKSGITFTDINRTDSLDDNLIVQLTQDAKREFTDGQGNELHGKMKSLYSSSALVYNVFEHWRHIPKAPLMRALSRDCFFPQNIVSLELEYKSRTVLGGTAPHLDVAMLANDGRAIGIEAKFTEQYAKRTSKKAFENTYFPTDVSSGLWEKLGLKCCESLATMLYGNPKEFMYLDAAQLLKHILGLQTQHGSDFTLIYLYYEWPSPEAIQHRTDVQRFTRIIAGEVSFCSMSSNELHAAMQHDPGIEPTYLTYLFKRYFDI